MVKSVLLQTQKNKKKSLYSACLAWDSHKGNEDLFIGRDIIEEGYYIRNTGNYKTLITDILPVLYNFKNTNIIISNDDVKNASLIEYTKLLNIEGINFIKAKNIKDVINLKELPVVLYGDGKDAFFNLWWLLRIRSLAKPYNFKKILIQRKYNRFVSEEIEKFLLSRGFNIVVLEDIPVHDQISMFAGAEQIVAAHGAGLANSAFCKNNCKILEISLGFNIDYYATYTDCINNLLSPKTKIIYDKIISEEMLDPLYLTKYNDRRRYLTNRGKNVDVSLPRFIEKYNQYFT